MIDFLLSITVPAVVLLVFVVVVEWIMKVIAPPKDEG